jgi:hypothetical protein
LLELTLLQQTTDPVGQTVVTAQSNFGTAFSIKPVNDKFVVRSIISMRQHS